MLLEIPIFLFHVIGIWFETLYQLMGRATDNFIDFGNLIKLVFAIEKRVPSISLEQNTPETPHIHLIPIITTSEQTLRWSIPSCCNIFSIWFRTTI